MQRENMDFVYCSDLSKIPTIFISIQKINHVYLGLYKGTGRDSNKPVTHYFWAEQDKSGDFFRFFISDNMNKKEWVLDAIKNENLNTRYNITPIQQKLISQLEERNKKILTSSNKPTTFVKNNIKNNQLSLRNDQADDLKSDFLNIMSLLNNAWNLDSKLNFEVKR